MTHFEEVLPTEVSRSNDIIYPMSRSSQFCKNIFAELNKEDSTIKSVLTVLFDNLKILINKEVDFKDLVRTSLIRSDYKSEHFFMNTFVDYLISNGYNPQPGDVFPFINVSDYNPRTSQSLRWDKSGASMRHPDFWVLTTDREGISVIMYIEELNSNGFDREFERKFGSSYQHLSEIKYVSKSRRTTQNLTTPIKLIVYLYEDNRKDLSDAELQSYMTGFIEDISGRV